MNDRNLILGKLNNSNCLRAFISMIPPSQDKEGKAYILILISNNGEKHYFEYKLHNKNDIDLYIGASGIIVNNIFEVITNYDKKYIKNMVAMLFQRSLQQ